jgi:hypothetical protein
VEFLPPASCTVATAVLTSRTQFGLLPHRKQRHPNSRVQPLSMCGDYAMPTRSATGGRSFHQTILIRNTFLIFCFFFLSSGHFATEATISQQVEEGQTDVLHETWATPARDGHILYSGGQLCKASKPRIRGLGFVRLAGAPPTTFSSLSKDTWNKNHTVTGTSYDAAQGVLALGPWWVMEEKLVRKGKKKILFRSLCDILFCVTAMK